MAVQRFLPDVARTRRAAGWSFIAVGVLTVVGLSLSAFTTGRFNGATLVFLALPAALAAWGLRLALRHEVVVEVDLNKRTYAVIREGQPAGYGPLDDLGPLAVSQRTRASGTSNNPRSTVEYVVNPAVHSNIDFYILSTPGKARRKMEDLARAWRLPCRSYGGTVRAAGALDVPLHERLRDDPEAMAIAPLRPDWGLRIEPIFRGHSIVSTHRTWAPLLQNAPVAIVLFVLLGGAAREDLLSRYWQATGDLLERVLLGLMGVVVVAMVWKLWQGARDTFFPGAVQITERGVSYRGTRMTFVEIEEVTADVPIEIVGDRRILSLAPSFCPRAALGPLAHELQRLILDVAPKGPQRADAGQLG
jgi:hypothetical protein